jgi:hypothetical protein
MMVSKEIGVGLLFTPLQRIRWVARTWGGNTRGGASRSLAQRARKRHSAGGPHVPYRWQPWAGSSRGGLGPDFASWAALSTGPSLVKTFQYSNSFQKTRLL